MGCGTGEPARELGIGEPEAGEGDEDGENAAIGGGVFEVGLLCFR